MGGFPFPFKILTLSVWYVDNMEYRDNMSVWLDILGVKSVFFKLKTPFHNNNSS